MIVTNCNKKNNEALSQNKHFCNIQKDKSIQHKYKLNSKIAHKHMRRYNKQEEQIKQESAAKRASFTERQIMSPIMPIKPIILQQEAESESGGQQDGKFSMQQLCKAFIDSIGSKINHQFEARQLIQLTSVKQRRIYDLMNILQGCAFLKRVSKGTYIWYGFEESESKKVHKEGRKKEATSLSNLAARVKNLLFNSQYYLDFKDICQKILQENDQYTFKPDSIKRRVYECCKVFKILGLVDKKEHTFKWITNQDRQRTHQKAEQLKKTIGGFEELDERETHGKDKNRMKHGLLQEDSIISELLRTVNTESELEGLLAKIKIKFAKKIQRKLQSPINPKRLFQ